MHKRLISFFLVFSLLLSLFSVSAFADDAHQHTFENKREYDLTNLPDGYQIPFTVYEAPCSGGCGYSEYSWNIFGISGKFVDKTGTPALTVYKHYREWFESTYGQNATATKAPSGIGRKDLPGYADDKGTPAVGKDGTFPLSGSYSFLGYSTYGGSSLLDNFTFDCSHSWRTRFGYNTYGNFYTTYSNGAVSVSGHLSSDASAYRYFSPIMAAYYFVAPHDGYYTVSAPTASVVASVKRYDGSYANLGNDKVLNIYYSPSHKESNGLYSCSAYTGYTSGSDYATLTYSMDKPPYSFA